MKTHEHIQEVFLPTESGKIARFPISRNVLVLSRLKKVVAWRPSLIQQAASLVLMLALCVSSYGITYGNLNSTLAYFRDDEVSTGNILQAGALDFTVSPDGDVSAIIEAGERLVLPIMTPEPDTFPTMYRVSVEEVGGPNLLCTLLDAEATTTPFMYSGDLLALSVSPTTTTGVWPLEVSLPSAAELEDGDECVVDLVYNGWHKDVPENTGYTDEERFRLTLTYTEEGLEDFNIVLNEFLPFPDGEAYGFDFGNDGSNMPQGEWIELYNKGDAPVDVLNWYITDASGGGGNTHAVIDGTNTIPASTIIPPGGWLVVYMNKPTLNNVGDEIHLYTDNDVEVDFVSYQQPGDGCDKEPSPGETNPPDLPIGTPGNGAQADCNQAQVPPNKSYARIPDGTGAWVDPIPTPGTPNIPDPIPEEEPEPEPEIAGATDELAPAGGGGGGGSAPEESAQEPEEETATTTPEQVEEAPDENPEVTPPEPEEPEEDTASTTSEAIVEEDNTASTTPEQAETPPAEEPEETTESEDPQAEETPEPEAPQEDADETNEESTEPPPPVDVPPPPAEEPPPPPPADDPAPEVE